MNLYLVKNNNLFMFYIYSFFLNIKKEKANKIIDNKDRNILFLKRNSLSSINKSLKRKKYLNFDEMMYFQFNRLKIQKEKKIEEEILSSPKIDNINVIILE
ncbi:MAG: hypothetical protein H5U37_07160 [Caldisericia bacterium]|nr:hypothetical protein [Caldisericia bacterium]